MIIRLADQNDKEAVLKLLDELLVEVESYDKKLPKHTPVPLAGSKLFDVLIKQKDYKIFVAEKNGNILGVATLFFYPVLRRGHYRAQLEELVVTKKLRDIGVGSKILQSVLKYCKENKIPSLRLNTGVDYKKAHKFYERHGGRFSERMYRFDF